MVLKASFKLAFLAIEILLTFYEEILENSLMVKFLLFVITAILIAMAVIRLVNTVLPIDNDLITAEED